MERENAYFCPKYLPLEYTQKSSNRCMRSGSPNFMITSDLIQKSCVMVGKNLWLPSMRTKKLSSILLLMPEHVCCFLTFNFYTEGFLSYEHFLWIMKTDLFCFCSRCYLETLRSLTLPFDCVTFERFRDKTPMIILLCRSHVPYFDENIFGTVRKWIADLLCTCFKLSSYS